jgi:DNA mismatch repair protein MutS
VSATSERQTPMMRQYRAIKALNPSAILFFRMGDFYEMFFEDAEIASRALNLTLTTRDRNSESPVPMAGFPWHAADRYISRLIRQGHRVVVCDQVEDPATAKGLVERAVTEIVTPGTAMTDTLLEARENNFIAAAAFDGATLGLALADVSTGEFSIDEGPADKFLEALERYDPREIVIAEESPPPGRDGLLVTERPGWHFAADEGEETLRRHFGLTSLEGLGLGPLGPALGAAGALLRYLKEVRGADLKHITGMKRLEASATMFLDDATRRHLEIMKPSYVDGPDTSLLAVLDRTATAAGGRRLRSWLEQPLLERKAIEERLAAVGDLYENTAPRESLISLLKRVHDMERLLGRAACGKSGPRDLKSLGETALLTPALREAASSLTAGRLVELAVEIEDLSPLGNTLLAALVDNPPASASDAGIFREGYSAELDELRNGTLSGKQWIAALQERERARTGIPSLKVGYNKVFGYYLEVTHTHQALVPADYIRKQTLVNAERYVTPDLKDQESKVLGAEERIRQLETELFRALRDSVVALAPAIRRTASALAEIDVLLGLAQTARERSYVRPEIVSEPVLRIREGRHPVVEKLLPSGQFVPNDLDMDSGSRQFLIITGPNMAGKSTYLRQAALIVLMAQIGSFVPAAEARIGIVDRIFTRIGASDHIARGRSTFMVEMQETAAILRNATTRSLVVLDEVGRGTSTFDGLSIAWAVAEYLHDGAEKPRTLFATHYHELTHLARDLERVVNLNVLVREWNDEVRFLHRIVAGAADRSYGIQVARLAGLPAPVLDRAREVLKHLEAGRFDRVEMSTHETSRVQLELFTPALEEWRSELRRLDVDRMTPVEALAALDRLKRKYVDESAEEENAATDGERSNRALPDGST